MKSIYTVLALCLLGCGSDSNQTSHPGAMKPISLTGVAGQAGSAGQTGMAGQGGVSGAAGSAGSVSLGGGAGEAGAPTVDQDAGVEAGVEAGTEAEAAPPTCLQEVVPFMDDTSVCRSQGLYGYTTPADSSVCAFPSGCQLIPNPPGYTNEPYAGTWVFACCPQSCISYPEWNVQCQDPGFSHGYICASNQMITPDGCTTPAHNGICCNSTTVNVTN